MTWEWRGDEPTEPFDQELAGTYIGKYVLIGISHQNQFGELLRREQIHGHIVSVAPNGLTVSLRGAREGEFWVMPPAPELLEHARPGTYTFYSTGEKVENPDFLATWTITEPPLQ
jgi:hypothetical protein